jgi:hypothetical protein
MPASFADRTVALGIVVLRLDRRIQTTLSAPQPLGLDARLRGFDAEGVLLSFPMTND